jgi:hypothetical protein
MWVTTSRDGGDFTRTRRLGAARFEQGVRREIIRRGGQKPSLRILRGLFTALSDPAGVIAHRAGALERVALLMEDWQLTKHRLTETEHDVSRGGASVTSPGCSHPDEVTERETQPVTRDQAVVPVGDDQQHRPVVKLVDPIYRGRSTVASSAR